MSSRTTATQDLTKEPTCTDPPTELKFFLFSDPAEAKSRDNKRLVRSHVARTSHAKTRHARAGQREVAPRSSQEPVLEEDSHKDRDGMGFSSFRESLPHPTPSTSMASSSVAYDSPIDFTSQPMALLDPGRQHQFLPFLQQLSQWEQFLFNHYVTVLIPSRHDPCDHPYHPIDISYYRHGMIVHWVRLCLTDVGLLQGIFLASCRNLAKIHRNSANPAEADMYEQRALQYRGECLRSMHESMSRDGKAVTDYTVGKALFLAFNEAIQQKYMAGNLNETRSHMAACEDLVELKGGHYTLGLDGFLSQLIIWFKQELSGMEETVPS
ncbi:hypothetical protein VMCG_09004 [Cytospora schulzeri]|uniref:Uncharacterized protein n=1 Tax=Cytospora schulzeri TaxID=448051 RepID=A0A423VPP3_9PEZI|nr:hypothetical protein VMCG_09004 [Valsa malicola]